VGYVELCKHKIYLCGYIEASLAELGVGLGDSRYSMPEMEWHQRTGFGSTQQLIVNLEHDAGNTGQHTFQ
jgi:hypothetical protein